MANAGDGSPAATEASRAAQGVALLLLQAQPDWVNRRVEQLEFLDTRAVRIRLSIDFVVPEDAPTRDLGGQTFRLVPITSLPKGNLVAFDLRDENEGALWLPTSEESSGLMAAALVFWAEVNRGGKSLPDYVERVLTQTAAADTPERGPALRLVTYVGEEIDATDNLTTARTVWQGEIGTAYRSLAPGQWYGLLRRRARARKRVMDAAQSFYGAHVRVEQAEQECRGRYGPPSAGPYAEQLKELMGDVFFRSQLQELARNFVVYVGVTSTPGARRIVKLVRDRPIAYVRAATFWDRLAIRLRQLVQQFGLAQSAFDHYPVGGRGGSHHLEVIAPAGVDVVSITASPVTPRMPGDPRPPEQPLIVVGGTPRVHIRVRAERAVYRATIFLRVSRPGWFTASALIAAVIAAVMIVGALEIKVLFSASQATGETGTAATLLLTLLAAFATFLVRPGEHPLAAKLLLLARWLIGIDVAVVLVAAGDLVLHHHPGAPTTLWWWLAGISGFVFLVLGASWLRTLVEDWRFRGE